MGAAAGSTMKRPIRIRLMLHDAGIVLRLAAVARNNRGVAHENGLIEGLRNIAKVACAVERRLSLAGANPARQLSLQPVAIGADYGGNDIVRSTLTDGPSKAVQRPCGPQRE